jgi:catechol 2,3-dioxygenase-like lactoylglutathione lyase family enzyme
VKVYALEHVQVAIPPNQEVRARAFYGGILGLTEVPKPPPLAARGGLWFEQPGLKLHLGVEADFRPARKAHVALLVDGLAALVEACRRAGHSVVSAEPLEGFQHVYVSDPFGNRIELMEHIEPGPPDDVVGREPE